MFAVCSLSCFQNIVSSLVTRWMCGWSTISQHRDFNCSLVSREIIAKERFWAFHVAFYEALFEDLYRHPRFAHWFARNSNRNNVLFRILVMEVANFIFHIFFKPSPGLPTFKMEELSSVRYFSLTEHTILLLVPQVLETIFIYNLRVNVKIKGIFLPALAKSIQLNIAMKSSFDFSQRTARGPRISVDFTPHENQITCTLVFRPITLL